MFFFKDIPIGVIRFPQWLWFKFYWYKYIKRVNIIGFFGRMPIIGSENMEEE